MLEYVLLRSFVNRKITGYLILCDASSSLVSLTNAGT